MARGRLGQVTRRGSQAQAKQRIHTPSGQENNMKVGFIGLGAMGKPIALHLAQAGYELTVYNRTPGHAAELERAGAKVVQSAAAAAASAEVVMTILADDRALEAVMFGDQASAGGQSAAGALKAMTRGAIHVSL